MAKIPISAAAREAGVDVSTVRRWCNEGKLDFSLTPGGHRRIEPEDLFRLLHPEEGSRSQRKKSGSPRTSLPRMLDEVESFEFIDLTEIETRDELAAYIRWIDSDPAGLIAALERFRDLVQDELDFRDRL